jgi:phage terminase large subunit-like protein
VFDGLGGRQCPCRAEGERDLDRQPAVGSAKIDPLMAAFNAIALMSTNPCSSQPSIFLI